MANGVIITKARGQAKAAYAFPSLTVSDLAHTPCPNRVQILDRFIARAGQRHGEIAFDLTRLAEKLRITAILKDAPGRDAKLREISQAMNVLHFAKDDYARKLRTARDVRGWARRTCRL